MKKVLMILLLLALCVGYASVALAQFGALDGMNREELLSLKKEATDKLNAMLFDKSWFSGEAVTLEPGIYQIGKDIPYGKWSVEQAEPDSFKFYLCGRLSEDGKAVTRVDMIDTNANGYNEYPEDHEFIIDCQNIMYLEAESRLSLTRVE